MQIIVPTGEVAYPFVFKPQPPMAGSTNKDPTYQLVIVYDEDDKRLDKLKKAIEDVAVAKFGAKAKKMLESGQLKSPLRKGEGRADWLEGKLTMTARSTDKPEVVDRDLEEIIRQSDFYSGCRARNVQDVKFVVEERIAPGVQPTIEGPIAQSRPGLGDDGRHVVVAERLSPTI